ncbi:glycosyltransferase [Rhodococcoides kyotonense]|uniref:Glycosyltransferase family 28 C-terminal domain-containing protein n=1 Tax=Rhodococcoides kyotonense TaxID=398843 RepID=A0A239MJ88_9NOCA|nr:glycosyltransferase [Rhodococcus kyotonensis]SNT42132.1 Glycosyltransferase family 28 C-terminal domain-containing protein [Rhodococcus kyotonensis]
MIGYYAHHHGSGHVTRATSIADALEEPVVVLSSRNRPAHSDIEWISLPLDVDENEYPVDPTAGGAVHWAPLGVPGLTDRMASIAEWVTRTRPRLFVVDVSVEVALFVRLLGVPVVVMAMPGERTDEPHRLAYQMATHIIAPWSRSVYDPAWLRIHADKTDYVGVISRFDGRVRETQDDAPDVLVLGGAGGTALTERDIDDASAADQRFRWAAVGIDASNWVDDVWPLLCSATVVVTHAGQNAIADVACAGVRAIVVPQQRPYDEQEATARALSDASVAVTVPRWPAASDWPQLLDDALALNPAAWEQVRQHEAAGRAADALTRLMPS